MKSILLVVLSAALAAVACTTKENENIETWWVNSAKVECTGVSPTACLQVQQGDEIDPEAWDFFYSTIEGFDYEPGNIYQIEVKSSPKENVPADASSVNYELVKVLSKEPDPALRLTNIWKVTSVGEVENPTNEQTDEALIFEIDASARTYHGDIGCNSVRGDIKENDGEKLVLGPGATTMMACPDMSVEDAISKALIDTRSYKLENNQLSLMNEAGETLITFQAVD